MTDTSVGGKGLLKLAHLPHIVALGGKLVAKEYTAVQHLIDLLFFLCTKDFKTGHDCTSLLAGAGTI